MLKQFIISQDVINALLEYLKKRPFVEVSPVIPILANLPEFKEPETKNIPNNEKVENIIKK